MKSDWRIPLCLPQPLSIKKLCQTPYDMRLRSEYNTNKLAKVHFCLVSISQKKEASTRRPKHPHEMDFYYNTGLFV